MKQSRFWSLLLLTVLVCTVTDVGAATRDSDAHPLYATMAQGADGKYVVTELSKDHGEVNLYNLTLNPKVNTATYWCGQFINGHLRSPERCPPAPFRHLRMDTKETIAINAFTLGIFGLIGGSSKESFFDYEEFDRAKAEALPEATRKNLIESYEIVENTIAKMNQLRADTATRTPTVVITVVDQSGFYHNDIDFTSDVTVAATLPSPPVRLTTVADDLLRAAEAAPAQLAAYRFRLENEAKVYKVKAVENQYSKYIYKITTPSEVTCKEGAPVVPAKVAISSTDFGVVYPSLTAMNKDLRVAFNGKDLEVTNLTDSFVRFSVVSIYHGDKIKTVTRPSDSDWVVPPNGVSKFPLLKSYTAEIDKLATYNHVTAAEAKRRKVHFGVALNYRVGDLSKEMSLYEAKNFDLFKVLLGAN